MATPPSILAWEIAGTEGPGGLSSTWDLRVTDNLVIKPPQFSVTHMFLFFFEFLYIFFSVSLIPKYSYT